MDAAPTDAPRPRIWSVWVWPAVAVVIVAVAGQLFGLLGAMIAAGSAVASLFFVVGEILLVGTQRRWMAALAVMTALGVVGVFAWQGALPWARVGGATSSPPVPFQAHGGKLTPEDVEGKNLRGALLAGADLASLDLTDMQFDGVDAPGASFHAANLTNASLRGANLRGADLSDACLQGADLAGAELTGAKVDDASVVLPAGMLVIGTPLPPGQRANGCP